MNKSQATREAKKRFGKTAGTRVYPCHGQAVFAGKQTTRGCHHNHLQPCPGGPLVYEIYHEVTIPLWGTTRCIDLRGDSWEDCFATHDKRLEDDRKRHVKPKPHPKPR